MTRSDRVRTDSNERVSVAEGDFFRTGNALRLRHRYGKLGPVLAGQTWSTFMDEAVMPDLVNSESPTGALLTRRGLLR